MVARHRVVVNMNWFVNLALLLEEKALSPHIHITQGNIWYAQIAFVKVVKSKRSMDLYLRLNANEKNFH